MIAMMDNEDLVYLRISRADLPELTDPEQPYVFGKMTKIRECKDGENDRSGNIATLAEAMTLENKQGLILKLFLKLSKVV